ncbi:uncharacterized protein N7515_008282 [Penicillium bovifimosum]|uniref:Uncharacterized protein n=1 Tax=Penicillium bovifimosum TaxID=126998 RepID=A0A9W9GNV4_9EURO|nr:uncharacterized protein N7515_008282 [Penicillium bovifimosum]KAJ5124457.1 hypothetical protein N7515_008282 [Penicillium bovifimosum]
MKSSSTKTVSPPAVVSDNFFDEHFGAFHQDDLNYPDSGIGSVDASWTFWPPSDLSIMDDVSLGLEGYSSIYTTGQNQHSAQHLVSPISLDTQPPVDRSTNSALNELQDIAPQDHRYHFEEAAPTTNYNRVASPPQTTNPIGDTDDALFMYYLDEVFYIQYPFFHSQKKQGRGWLFAILRRVKSAYHAALALSERQMLSGSSSRNGDIASSLIQLRNPNSHYDIAIQELQTVVNDPNASKGRGLLLHSIEILMSILQLLFFEARTPPLTTPDDSALCPEVDCAFKFVLGSFIAFDIISSASTRSNLTLNINHLQVLGTFNLSLESHTGCRDSVMALVLEISLLDKWKEEAKSANKLSYVELVKRGDGILSRLRQELAAIEGKFHSWTGGAGGGSLLATPPPAMSTSNTPTSTHAEISKVFILAAITYLHVVISGPYPEVPEIAESVSETVLAFKSLKDPRLLRSSSWDHSTCYWGVLRGFTNYGRMLEG